MSDFHVNPKTCGYRMSLLRAIFTVALGPGSLKICQRAEVHDVVPHVADGLKLRLDAKHVFNIGPRRLVNPYRLYPSDYPYNQNPDAPVSIADIASLLAEGHLNWLQQQGGKAGELLKHIDAPAFHLGIQVAIETGYLRPLLEIDGVEIGMEGRPLV